MSALEQDHAALSLYSGATMSSPYGALALRTNHYGQSDEELAAMQTELEEIAVEVEAAAIEAGQGISAAVHESREYAQHRQFLYMVGAPAIVITGLSNKKYPMLGLFTAAIGAYVGVKNYQDHKASEPEAYAGYGTVRLPRPKCVPAKRSRGGRNRRCPPGYRPRYRADGRMACCRR